MGEVGVHLECMLGSIQETPSSLCHLKDRHSIGEKAEDFRVSGRLEETRRDNLRKREASGVRERELQNLNNLLFGTQSHRTI